MAHQLEARVIKQMQDVVFRAGEEVIQTDDIVAVVQQAFAQVRAEEIGAACHERAGTVGIVFHWFNFLIFLNIAFVIATGDTKRALKKDDR